MPSFPSTKEQTQQKRQNITPPAIAGLHPQMFTSSASFFSQTVKHKIQYQNESRE